MCAAARFPPAPGPADNAPQKHCVRAGHMGTLARACALGVEARTASLVGASSLRRSAVTTKFESTCPATPWWSITRIASYTTACREKTLKVCDLVSPFMSMAGEPLCAGVHRAPPPSRQRKIVPLSDAAVCPTSMTHVLTVVVKEAEVPLGSRWKHGRVATIADRPALRLMTCRLRADALVWRRTCPAASTLFRWWNGLPRRCKGS